MARRHRLSRTRQRSGDGSWVVDGRVERFVEPCVLLTLREGRSHGYQLAEALGDWFPSERIDLGNLYRMLRTLEAEGIVASEWRHDLPGRSKRTYELAPAGEALLDAWVISLESTKDTVARFLRRAERR